MAYYPVLVDRRLTFPPSPLSTSAKLKLKHYGFLSSTFAALIHFYQKQQVQPATRAYFQGFSLRPRLFCPLDIFILFTPFVIILGHFWCSVVTSIKFRTKLSNFETKQKKILKIQIKSKNSKNVKKSKNKSTTFLNKFKKNLKKNL